ncbi:MAG TPA: toll/interleukin-1 receptor domain-containing protein [Pyrinomonadaceae bacterium]|jgi:hypothetical protein
MLKFDVFISYASADRDPVARLVARLKRDGYAVWYDQEQMAGGGIVLRQLSDGILNSAHMIACLSDAYIERDFTTFELDMNQALDPANRLNRTIPVVIGRLKDRPIPPTIIGLNRRDLTNPATFDAEYQQITRDITRQGEQPQDAPAPAPATDGLEDLRRACRAPFERATDEPVVVLFLMGRAARALCLFLHTRAAGAPADTMTLDALAERLAAERVLPPPERTSLTTVLNYGNIVVDDRAGDQNAVTHESIQPGLAALKVLARWTFRKYFPELPAAEVEQIWAAPVAPVAEVTPPVEPPVEPPTPTAPAEFASRLEVPLAAQGAWPLGAGRLLVWDKAGALAVVGADGRELWREAGPLQLRRAAAGPDGQLAVGGWEGRVRCFADGAAAAQSELQGAVGDLQFCAGRWVVGTWRHSLVSVTPGGAVTDLLGVSHGVLAIAAQQSADWFAVADLRGGIALYREGRRVSNLPPMSGVTSLAFAGRRLMVLAGEQLCGVDTISGQGHAERRPGEGRARLLGGARADSCLLVTSAGQSWLISESGIHQPYLALPAGARLLSTCRVPRRVTLRLAAGGCAYWNEGTERQAWPEATAAHLSADGRFVAVLLPDKVQLYEEPG